MTHRIVTQIVTQLAAAALCLACNQSAYRLDSDVTIPFELANNNVYVSVRVGQSTPHWFILDTGDKYALIDLATAQSLGLNLKEDAAEVHGASGGSIPGRFVDNGRFSLVGLEGFSQPLFLALPLDGLAKATGHEFAGIVGFDFLSQFVVEVDYVARTITLHDRKRFQYHGTGETFPITFDAFAHPLVQGRVTIDGHAAFDGAFVADMGSSSGLTLHTPFVNREHLLPPTSASISRPGGHGVGGAVGASAIGRIEALAIGHVTITHPVVAFSQTTDGPLASKEADGTIGGDILRRFRVILDYGRRRMILEPNAHLADPLDFSMSGLELRAGGPGYRTFTIDTVFDRTPASEAGIHKGDVLAALDGRSAAEYTLSEIKEIFKREGSHDVTIARDAAHLKLKLTLRRLI